LNCDLRRRIVEAEKWTECLRLSMENPETIDLIGIIPLKI
jgi:hypothetical protein